jgi:acyl-CoA thioester hydrolase
MSDETPTAPALGRWPVTIELPVLWGDMDAFDHVNNAVYLRWFESARIAYFERVGVIARMTAEGVGPILARASVDYRAPLRYPDTVRVAATVTRLGHSSFVMGYRVTSAAHGGAVAAEGEGVVVLVDYRRGGSVALDDATRAAIAALEAGAPSGVATQPSEATGADDALAFRSGADAVDFAQLRELFREASFRHGGYDDARLVAMVRGSRWVESAWRGARLVGFARAISDGVSNAYVSSVVVAAVERRRGIGRELMRRLLAGHAEVKFALHSRPDARELYRALGFEPQEDMFVRRPSR